MDKQGNMLSMIDHPEVVADYIKKETKGVHCSPFGAIPKKN